MIIESEIVQSCILCGKNNFRVIALTLRPNVPHFCRIKCIHCGLVISSPMATSKTLKEYYRNYYTTGDHADQTLGDGISKRLRGAEKVVNEIRKYKAQGCLLDIGCGAGHVCKAAENVGFDSYGLDLSETGINFARRHFGLTNMICGELFDCNFEDRMFDVIHCWHLIEHVIDPASLIREIYRILAPGGYLYWGTDNHNSIGYEALRVLCFLSLRVPPIYDGVEHTYGFCPQTIKMLLESNNFILKSIKTYADPFSLTELIDDAHQSGIGKAFRTLSQSIFRIKMKGIAQKKQS